MVSVGSSRDSPKGVWEKNNVLAHKGGVVHLCHSTTQKTETVQAMKASLGYMKSCLRKQKKWITN